MTTIKVTLPCFYRGGDRKKYEDYLRNAENAKKLWINLDCAADIYTGEIPDLTDRFWYTFDIKKLEILLELLESDQGTKGDVVYVVSDTDVTPTDATVTGLAALGGQCIGFAKGGGPCLENSLIACRATETMAKAIKLTLIAMKSCDCKCDTPYNHSFRGTVALLPACIYVSIYGYRDPLSPPTCPDNCHYNSYLEEVRLDIMVEHNLTKGLKEVNGVPVTVPKSSH